MADLIAAISIEKMPPEILKLILSNLDEKELLPCRLVNPSWKHLVNEILCEKSSLWNDHLKFLFMSKWSTLHRLGTRFSTPGQITRFISEMKTTPNPFPNGTVIFIPDKNLKKNQLIAFHANVCRLLNAFNDVILNLVYFIPYSKSPTRTDLSYQFRTILNLKNLKSLVIEKCFDWEHVDFLRSTRSQQLLRKMLESSKATLPEKLRELHIHGWYGVIPLSYLFGGNESILKSVSSLEISNKVGNQGLNYPDCAGQIVDFPMCQFPNLQKLKVRYPDAEFLKQFQQFKPNSARLKEISFYFEIDSKDAQLAVELDLKEIFELVDSHAETLELFHLDFGLVPDSVINSELFTPVKYPKLKTLILHYNRIERWPLAISQLMAKLVNLQEFKLSLPERETNPREQSKKVDAFWDLIPPTVKVITVPNYGWKVKRGETL